MSNRVSRRRGFTVTAKECETIRRLHASGVAPEVIRERFSIAKSLIHRILNDPEYMPPEPVEYEENQARG